MSNSISGAFDNIARSVSRHFGIDDEMAGFPVVKYNGMDRFLEVGDVFRLHYRQKVYAQIPEKFIYSNKSGSADLSEDVIQVGRKKSGKEANGDTCLLETSDYAGEYVVTRSQLEGGGMAHGPHDVFPDGQHITAVKTNGSGVVIKFYQSGCFTCMLSPKEIDFIEKRTEPWLAAKGVQP